ncbi:MAG: hypothetical protein K2O91_26125 [Lachnospiraceae bacterium]|nr:hypothetical protein [Lachnospiraceae bacterium]
MKRKHYKGQKHYSGKELLKRRKIEREEYEKRLSEQKPEDVKFLYKSSMLPGPRFFVTGI